MTFRDFKNEVFLVLQVKEGEGFGISTDPLIVTANLLGNVHESLVTEPCPHPRFENEFVWVMEKSKMKSIWSDKVPVRVECISVNNNRRRRIGYVILNLKDAQIVHDDTKVTEKEVCLLGLSKEDAILKPALTVSFFITDSPIKSPQLSPHFSARQESGRVHMADGPLRVSLGKGRDNFSININIDSTSNLKESLQSGSTVEPSAISYSYHMLGTEIVSDTTHSVSVAVTTSLATLKTYFLRNPTISVTLYLDSLAIGQTTINIQGMILSQDFHFKKMQPKTFPCRCQIVPTHNVTEVPPTSNAFVDFVVTISTDIPVVKKKSASLSANPIPPLLELEDKQQDKEPLQSPVTKPLVLSTKTNGGETYRTQPSIQENIPPDVRGGTYCTKPAVPQSEANGHKVTVTLAAFYIEQETPSLFLLSITGVGAEPHSYALPAVGTSLEWRISVLKPCTLILTSAGQVYAGATLTPPDVRVSREQTVVLEGCGQRVADVTVVWCPSESPPTAVHTLTSLTDSHLTLRKSPVSKEVDILTPRERKLQMRSFVEELEDWAEKQKILVTEELKKKEAELKRQWEAEAKGELVELRCVMKSLHDMTEKLHAQELENENTRRKLNMYKEDLERAHSSKLQEFKLAARRIQDEFNHKTLVLENEKALLEKEVKGLTEENIETKKRLKEVEDRGDEDRRLARNLTSEMKMLKEKLSAEQHSKHFFREHCHKSEMEVKRLNTLIQQEMESRLSEDKRSLKLIALQHLLVERHELRQDQKALGEIKQKLLQTQTNGDIRSSTKGGSVLSRSNEPVTHQCP